MIRQEISLTECDRQALAILMISVELEDVSVYHLQDALLVSRGTVLTDIKKIQSHAIAYGVLLKYTRKNGYRFYGNETAIRLMIHHSLLHSLANVITRERVEHLLNQYATHYYKEVEFEMHQFLQKNRLTVVPSRLAETIYFLAFVIIRAKQHPIQLTEKQTTILGKLIIRTKGNALVSHFSSILDKDAETDYFNMVLMGMIQSKVREFGTEFLYDCSYLICQKFEHAAGVVFDKFDEVVAHIYAHLVPAYFRMLGQFRIQNVIIEQIRRQYEHLFQLTQYSLSPLTALSGEKLADSEIGYFTILFGGEIANLTERIGEKRYQAIIVCPSGISSSLIMMSELASLFPMIDFIEAASLQELSKLSITDYDLIFSTVEIETQKLLYIIKPILTTVEKGELLRLVQEDLLIPSVVVPSVTEMLEAILPYVTLKDGITKDRIKKIATQKLIKQLNKKEGELPMLSDLLTVDKIQFNDQDPTPDWQSAIRLASRPLLDHQDISMQYVDAMIQKVKDYGPFIHLGFGIALPHARPEDGVHRLGMSLLKFENPVYLLDDKKHPIYVFICLAAVDNASHLRALSSLTKILTDKLSVQRLLSAKTTEEVVQLIQEKEE